MVPVDSHKITACQGLVCCNAAACRARVYIPVFGQICRAEGNAMLFPARSQPAFVVNETHEGFTTILFWSDQVTKNEDSTSASRNIVSRWPQRLTGWCVILSSRPLAWSRDLFISAVRHNTTRGRASCMMRLFHATISSIRFLSLTCRACFAPTWSQSTKLRHCRITVKL